jgi:hypothetical protein
MPDWQTADTLRLVASFIGGGSTGALLNWIFARRKERREMALKLVEQYAAMYKELGEVQGLLESPTHLKSHPQDMNRVRQAGNWFDFAALVMANGLSDVRLLKRIGIDQRVGFRERLHKEITEFGPMLEQWRHLREFPRKSRRR